MTGLERDAIITELRQSQVVTILDCPICGERSWEYFGGRFHFDIRVEYWICANCTLVAQSPRLEDEYLSKFYTLYYRFLYEGDSETTDAEFEFQIKRGRNLLSIFRDISSEKPLGHLLDFGCSAGGLLHVAKQEMGALSATGIELDHNYKVYTQSRGFTVFSDLSELHKHNNTDFDIITMSHVLEHVSDFRKTLNEIRILMRQDGYLCIEVPYASGRACFELSHLWGFNEVSLERLLMGIGFQVLGMKTHGYPRSPENNDLYLVVIAQKHDLIESQAVYSSSPFLERMKQYQSNHPTVSSLKYHRYLLSNTLKQIIGLKKGKLVAHSWMPTKLRE